MSLGFVCLIQIATWEYGDFLLDPIVLRTQVIEHLKTILEDPLKLKVMHGCANDILWLQKDFDIFLNGVADTQILHEKEIGIKQISYKNLCHKYYPQWDFLQVEETLSDWRLRPGKGITKSQEMYATNDVHILLRIFEKMRQRVSLLFLKFSFYYIYPLFRK